MKSNEVRNKIDLKTIIKNKLLFSNLELYTKYISDDEIIDVLKKTYELDKNYILSNLFSIINYYNTPVFYIKIIFFCNSINVDLNNIFSYIKKNNIRINNNLILVLLSYFDKENIVINNIGTIISNSVNLLELKKILVNHNFKDKYISLINNKIDNSPSLIKEEMIGNVIDVNSLKDDKILESLDIIINELKDYEKVKYHDFCLLGRGDYSTAYKIGNKVLKIGSRREKFNIKNNKRFLKPLYRAEILDKDETDIIFCIEITEYVSLENISYEDVYQVYKELRDDGLIWTDCRECNLGRLLKDNKVYFDNINHVDKMGTGYTNYNDEVLKKGDLVIIDNDYIYEIEDYLKYNYDPASEYFYEFEYRYQNEIKSKK